MVSLIRPLASSTLRVQLHTILMPAASTAVHTVHVWPFPLYANTQLHNSCYTTEQQ
jgi:hypothetical protein